MKDFSELIPELSEWNEGRGIDVESWINALGNFEHAIAYGRLFWPEFTEHDDCIFWAPLDVENYERWMNYTKGDKTAIEKVKNHVHIVDFFSIAPGPTKVQMIYFGRFLKELWECKLQRDFPGRSIVVDFFEPDGENPYDYEITFYQNR